MDTVIDGGSAASTNSATPAAVATPAGNPADNPAGNAASGTATAATAPAAPADDFDENLIPESSRENFRKYRETSKTKQSALEKERDDYARQSQQWQGTAKQWEQRFGQPKPVDLKDIGEKPKRPTLKDPNILTIEQYDAALEKWETDVEAWAEKKGSVSERQRVSQEADQRKQTENLQRQQQKARSAMQKYPDFAAKVQPLAQFMDAIPELQVFAAESDAGTDVVFHLASNPVLLGELSKMTPLARQKELIRLEGAITAPAPVRVTKAPEPITPVNTGADGSVKSILDQVKKEDVSDFVNRENRRLMRKGSKE